jgi:hypothetical protein
MSPRHLNCGECRIRVRADAPEIALLEGRCPICEATLRVSSASDVLGFRSFDLDALADQESRDRASSSGKPADFVGRREAAPAREDFVADGWSDSGGGVESVAVAKWAPAQ